MGQKVDPNGLRIGIIKPWEAKWYADKKNFADCLVEDDNIRKFIKKKYYDNAISKITIERAADKVVVSIYTARPATLIGKGGAGVEQIMKEVQALTTSGKKISVNIMEVKHADADAQLVAESIAKQLENRASFRRSMKQAMARAMKAGAKGVKTKVSGRLDGAEIARSESYHEGSIPLQTLRADIDYGVATAHTTFGAIGVKCWIYKGEVLGKNPWKEVTDYVDAQTRQKTPPVPWQNERQSQQGQHHRIRRIRPCGSRTGLDNLQPNRSRPCRNDEIHPQRRQGVGGHLPPQTRHQEACRNPYGQR